MLPHASSKPKGSFLDSTGQGNLGEEWLREWELLKSPLSKSPSPVRSTVRTRQSQMAAASQRSRACCNWRSTWRQLRGFSRPMLVWIVVFAMYYTVATVLTWHILPEDVFALRHSTDSNEGSGQRLAFVNNNVAHISRHSDSDNANGRKDMTSANLVKSQLRKDTAKRSVETDESVISAPMQIIKSESGKTEDKRADNYLRRSKSQVPPKMDSGSGNAKSNGNNAIGQKSDSDQNEVDSHSRLGIRPVFDKVAYNRGKESRLRVAIAVTITKNPGLSNGFLDSMGALAVSINEAQSKHRIELVALMHSNLSDYWHGANGSSVHRNGGLSAIDVMAAFGYDILFRELPFEASEVKNRAVAKEMESDGCCGLLETLKLWVWTLADFDYVLSLDADAHFHQNFDELFDTMQSGNYELGFTHGATAHINQELMNGGFLLVKPSAVHFSAMRNVMLEGDFGGGGWKQSGIGWVYGGRTIQGIVPYYFLTLSKNSTVSVAPANAKWMRGRPKHKVAGERIIELERCKYNNMVEIDRWTFENVTCNHFTVCQKPWSCIYQHMPLCDAFRDSWWRRSRRLETEFLGFEKVRRECKGRYQSIDYQNSTFIQEFAKFHLRIG